MIKGIIFDLDGVLVCTDKLHFEAWNTIAKEENIYFDEQINNRLRGVSRMDSLEIILEKASKVYSNDEKVALATKKNNIYVESLSSLSKQDLLDGVLETLQTLKENNIKIAIGSSSKNTVKILEQLGIKEMFDVIVDGNMIKHSKPHPEVFTKARKQLFLEKDEVLVVEDAKAGIEAAKRAKIKSVGINGADLLEESNYKIKNIRDLLPIVLNNKTCIKIEHVKKYIQTEKKLFTISI